MHMQEVIMDRKQGMAHIMDHAATLAMAPTVM